MLQLSADAYDAIVAHAYRELPIEACGLLIGPAGEVATSLAGAPEHGGPGPETREHSDCTVVDEFRPSANLSASALVYELDSRVLLRAEREAEDQGRAVVGVMHSHTHTAPYPSATDVAQAPDPTWHYVIVSLADSVASLRSFRIVDGKIIEEPVVVEGQ